MVGADLVRGADLVPVAVAGLAGDLPLWGLIVAAFLLETAMSCVEPAYGAAVPSLVDLTNVQAANARDRSSAGSCSPGCRSAARHGPPSTPGSRTCPATTDRARTRHRASPLFAFVAARAVFGAAPIAVPLVGLLALADATSWNAGDGLRRLNGARTGPRSMTPRFARIPGRALLAVPTVVAAALVAASVGAGAPPALKEKEAQARAVQAQVDALNVQLGRIVESYDGARYQLGQIKASIRHTSVALGQARAGYRAAQRRAADRLVAIYESGEPTTADALLGATSLSDMLDRLEAVDSATALDRRLVRQVTTLRGQLAKRAHRLTVAREQQQQTVTALAAQRKQIDAGIARQKQLLSTIQTQVATMRAAERARQRRLLLEAQARLAAERRARAAEAAAAAARERAAKEDAAAAAARRAATPTTTAADPPPPPTTSTQPTTTTAQTTTSPTPPTTTTAPPPTTTTAPPPVTTPSAGAGHPAAASIALHYLGVPYQWGGSTPSGFDCSGLVMYVYAQLGVSLPHYAAAQYQLGTPVDRANLQPGDLVFFDSLNHVGIWIGGNQFVDAPETGDVVKIETFSSWYAKTYVGARRI